jgi:ubiquinone/menaquinone biosynthesis C-methylase UbiE
MRFGKNRGNLMPSHEPFRHCPVWLSFFLDNWVRRIAHNPKKILSPFVRPGQTVLDVGCGPGVFTIPLAELVGEKGLVIAADIEDEMLGKVAKKAERLGLSSRIRVHKSRPEWIDVADKVDFILAFYMVHETPNQARFFEEARSILKDGGRMLVVEPKFHVSGSEYDETVKFALGAGLKPVSDVDVILSRGRLFER